jgi:hypothetical protein
MFGTYRHNLHCCSYAWVVKVIGSIPLGYLHLLVEGYQDPPIFSGAFVGEGRSWSRRQGPGDMMLVDA